MLTVFISPDLAPHLQHLELFQVNNINGSFFLSCDKIIDEDHFMNLVVSDNNPQDHGTEYPYELKIPYHAVLYIFSGPDEVNRRIPGFHRTEKAAENPPAGQDHS